MLGVHHGWVFASLAPARRRLVLGLLVAVLAAGVAVGVAAAIGTDGAHRVRQPVVQDSPGPVLLVPGYGGSTRSLDVLAAKLRALGRDVSIVSLAGDGTGDLRAQAELLGRDVSAALRRSHAQSVDVVGYSAGGVVARLWLRDVGGAPLARRVVLLGAPSHGTELAGLGALVPGACPQACQQLEPGSDLLASLNQGDETPAGPDIVSIWTTRDQVVVPPDSARLAGALNVTVQSVCAASDVTHAELPADPLVDAMVVAELAAGPPVPLSAQDCGRFGG